MCPWPSGAEHPCVYSSERLATLFASLGLSCRWVNVQSPTLPPSEHCRSPYVSQPSRRTPLSQVWFPARNAIRLKPDPHQTRDWMRHWSGPPMTRISTGFKHVPTAVPIRATYLLTVLVAGEDQLHRMAGIEIGPGQADHVRYSRFLVYHRSTCCQ